MQLPGDKSISHRYAMLAAVAEGRTEIDNYSTGADCGSTLECLHTHFLDTGDFCPLAGVDDPWVRGRLR